MVPGMYVMIYRLVVPLIFLYNICMLNENMMKVNKFEEWFCRGDRGIHTFYEVEVDVHKIERVFREIEKGNDCEEEMELNECEEAILYGDGGFMDDGMENVFVRLDKLFKGEVIFVEGEESIWSMGTCELEKVEIEFSKNKIEMLRG